MRQYIETPLALLAAFFIVLCSYYAIRYLIRVIVLNLKK